VQIPSGPEGDTLNFEAGYMLAVSSKDVIGLGLADRAGRGESSASTSSTIFRSGLSG